MVLYTAIKPPNSTAEAHAKDPKSQPSKLVRPFNGELRVDAPTSLNQGLDVQGESAFRDPVQLDSQLTSEVRLGFMKRRCLTTP